MRRPYNIMVAVFLMALGLSFSTETGACTIWASAGDAVKGGGTIVAKNRDNVSSFYTGLMLVFPDKGFRFFGILDVREDGYVAAAVNEKGLAVINASPNSVPRKKRHVATEDVTERILTTFDSVDALFEQKSLFEKTHPAIYIVADASKIMSVEVAPGGRVSTHVKANGTLAFTNHYTDDGVSDANERMSLKSLLRLKHINELLGGQGRPHSMDGFIAMSRSENDGKAGAVMRNPQKGSQIRTLATWVVGFGPGKAPELYISLFNQAEEKRTYRASLDENFWNLVSTENP